MLSLTPRAGDGALAAPFVLALLLASGAVGCSKPAPKPATSPAAGECPEGQTFDGQFCQVTGAPPPEAAPPVATASAEPPPAGTTPSSPPGPSTGTAPVEGAPIAPAPQPAAPLAPSLATPVDVSMAAQAGPLITYLASSHLPAGARPFGAPFAAQFAEGQVFEQQIKLTVGKCYTVIAAGLPPISEVGLELYGEATTTRSAGPLPVALALDEATGPQAVLGSRAGCIKADRADVWLVLRATKGQGVIAGQAFEK